MTRGNAPRPAGAGLGVPPVVTAENKAYFEAAGTGRLLIERCADCGCEIFPPRGVCRACRSRDLESVEVTGPGVVYSWTINHQSWLPDMEVPFGLVLVEFPDHPGVRIPGRVTGDLDRIDVGVQVDVGFASGPGDLPVVSFRLPEAP